MKIVGTLPSPPPPGGSAIVTVTETTADGTTLPPVLFTVTSPNMTFEYPPTFGSTYQTSEVNVSDRGLYSVPVTTPPFTPADPRPTPPTGPITYEVVP